MIIFSKINKLLVFLIITELSALYLRIYNFAEHHALPTNHLWISEIPKLFFSTILLGLYFNHSGNYILIHYF